MITTEYRIQNTEYKRYLLFVTIFLLLFTIHNSLFAEAAEAQAAGSITAVEGGVDILKAGAAAAVPVKIGDIVSIGDILRTKSDGKVEITFVDNSVMSVGPKSRLEIEEYLYKPGENKRVSSLKLHRGKTGFNIPRPVFAAEGSKFEMKTRTATAGVRGTGGLLLTGNIDRVYVKEGIVEFKNPLGSVTVTPGRVGEAVVGRVPTERPYSDKEMKSQEQSVKPTKAPDKKSEGDQKKDEGKKEDKAAAKADKEAAVPAETEAPPPPPPPPPTGSALSSIATGGISVSGPLNIPTTNYLPVTEATGATSTNTDVKIKIIHP